MATSSGGIAIDVFGSTVTASNTQVIFIDNGVPVGDSNGNFSYNSSTATLNIGPGGVSSTGPFIINGSGVPTALYANGSLSTIAGPLQAYGNMTATGDVISLNLATPGGTCLFADDTGKIIPKTCPTDNPYADALDQSVSVGSRPLLAGIGNFVTTNISTQASQSFASCEVYLRANWAAARAG